MKTLKIISIVVIFFSSFLLAKTTATNVAIVEGTSNTDTLTQLKDFKNMMSRKYTFLLKRITRE